MIERIIDLTPAYLWTCLECGTDQLERAVIIEFDDEDKAEMSDQYDDEFEAGEWMGDPVEVVCRQCGREFATREPD